MNLKNIQEGEENKFIEIKKDLDISKSFLIIRIIKLLSVVEFNDKSFINFWIKF